MSNSIELTKQELAALVGLLDIAIKQIGVRAFEDDICGLMHKIKKSAETEKDASRGSET